MLLMYATGVIYNLPLRDVIQFMVIKWKNTQKFLEYLSRYVFRIAITDRRFPGVKDGKVRFSWKDYRTGRFRQMKLDIDEFIRRFLLHV